MSAPRGRPSFAAPTRPAILSGLFQVVAGVAITAAGVAFAHRGRDLWLGIALVIAFALFTIRGFTLGARAASDDLERAVADLRPDEQALAAELAQMLEEQRAERRRRFWRRLRP